MSAAAAEVDDMRGTGISALTLVVALGAGSALAQDPAARDAREEWIDDEAIVDDDEDLAEEFEADEDEDAPALRTPRRRIKVLNHPYEIASFYRQREGSFFAPAPEGAPGPYGLAGFYRQGDGARPYGYSRFWTNGYGHHGRDSRGLVIGFRRSIGDHGDIFLLAPGFLAPLGPLTR